jgi:hypothetical protein
VLSRLKLADGSRTAPYARSLHRTIKCWTGSQIKKDHPQAERKLSALA